MKTSDLSNTQLVRKYGLRGVRLFARVWFPFMYALLIALTAGFWILTPEFGTGWRRIFLGLVVGGLTVLAASVLTRMRLEHLTAIEHLESRGKVL